VEPVPQPDLLFGSSAAMRRVLDDCASFARSECPVLLQGEPGTGKTVLARHIHRLSGRSGPFVDCSVGSIPAHLESAYFAGKIRGAHTDAYTDQAGVIEASHRGTLFLDEIGLASVTVQEILLEAFERHTVCRIGETRRRQVDVRIIAATNANLDEMCEGGRFRRDLLDRFGYMWIHVPPLRERRDEILPLINRYLAVEVASIGRSEPLRISDAVRDCLLAAPWPDNVRGIVSLCAFLAARCRNEASAELHHLPPKFVTTLGTILDVRVTQSLVQAARDAVARAGGNKSKAARELGISRRQIYRLLKQA
jgi:DNA-binding NtrC family response regulator